MVAQTLSTANALASGSQLWILPEPSQSNWLYKIDWHLNFQISKSRHHTTKGLSEQFTKLAQDFGFKYFDLAPRFPESLMIASSELLPNRFTLVLNFNGDLQDWIRQAVLIHRDLGIDQSRIFLPKKVSVEAAVKSLEDRLKNLGGTETDTISFVADLDYP